jgi:hypothetical protein
MNYHRHNQNARDLNRRLFQDRTERRAEAAYAFLRAVACLGLFAFIGGMLAWRG